MWAWGFGVGYCNTLISKLPAWMELSIGGGKNAAGDGGCPHGERGDLPWSRSLRVPSPRGSGRAFNTTKLTPMDMQTLVYRAGKS